MKHLTLLRLEQSQEGTFGFLLASNKIICATLELPWNDNKPFLSCIPNGVYECVRITSELVSNVGGKTYIVHNVPGRSGILFHTGNWVTDTDGCIITGLYHGYLKNPKTERVERVVLGSRHAFKRFMEEMEGIGRFVLVVRSEQY